MEDIPDAEKKEFTLLLNRYKRITVREIKAKSIIEQLGISNIQVVADPTLLLSPKQWKKFASKKLVEEQYLLIYSVEGKKQGHEVYSIAKKISKERNLKIVSINSRSFLSDIGKCDYNFHFSTFEDFLSFFLYADFIVVSSFHGTAFSINFQKQFLTISPNSFSSRIDSLLEICGLKQRRIAQIQDMPQVIDNIDYNNVNDKLSQLRANSLSILKEMLI